MLLLYTLWDDWLSFMISWFKWTATVAIGINTTKAWLSQLVNLKNDDTLEERYAIKFCFKLGKNARETYGMLQTAFRPSCVNPHQFLSVIRDSKKAGSLWGMMRGVGGVSKSIYQSWLAKGFGLGLLCWRFKGVQQEIPSEESSTLQIGSVAFPAGQCTSS